MHAGMSMAVGDGHFRPHAVGEDPTRALLGQVKTDGRPFHGLSRFVGDFHGERALAARPRSVYRPFALDDANLKDGDLSRRRRGERYNQRRCRTDANNVYQTR